MRRAGAIPHRALSEQPAGAKPPPRHHHLLAAAEVALEQAWPTASSGLARAELVGEHCGSVHMGLGLAELAAGGHIDTHVHSHEERRT